MRLCTGMEIVMKYRRRHAAIFCCILLLGGGLLGNGSGNSHTSVSFLSAGWEESSKSDTLIQDELFLLLNEGVSDAELSRLLSEAPFPTEILDLFDTCLLLRTAPEHSETLLTYFQENSLIRTAEYNQELVLSGITADEYSDTQWALSNPGSYLQYFSKPEKGGTFVSSTPGIDLNLNNAWNYYKKNLVQKRIPVVAIIDTGIDITHPELAAHIWINSGEIPGDGIDNDGNGYIDDIHGWDFYNNDATVCHYGANQVSAKSSDNDNHGTHLAGIIAAEANNDIGIAGVAGDVRVELMPLKIHGGSNGKGTIANAVKAIRYATLMGADICNMSWGATVYSTSLEEAMRESTMLFITAAGNEGNSDDIIPMYPACFDLDNMISVTFVDADGELPSDANYGADSIDFAAPGKDIFSTVVGSYQTMSGSSMAAPHVSALAALVYSLGKWYAPEVKQLFLSSLLPVPALEGNVRYPGIPNALLLLEGTKDLTVDIIAPALAIQQSFSQEILSLYLTAEDKGGSGIRVLRYAAGTKSVSAFRKGTAGTPIRSDTLELTKAGYYTFYLSDYAGNETIVPFYVIDDTEPPELKATYAPAASGRNFSVLLDASDSQSGIKTLKYAEGILDAAAFKSGTLGTELTLGLHGQTSFSVEKPGNYTIYAADYRGNKAVLSILIQELKVKSISLNHTGKILSAGDSLYLKPEFHPAGSTDSITYKSSRPSVATVNQYGSVTALSPGITVITATTSHGLTAKCLLLVTYGTSPLLNP